MIKKNDFNNPTLEDLVRAEQLLTLLRKGWEEGLWPVEVQDLPCQPDVGLTAIFMANGSAKAREKPQGRRGRF